MDRGMCIGHEKLSRKWKKKYVGYLPKEKIGLKKE